MQGIIRQAPAIPALPDLRNLGTILRVLLAVNGATLLVALAREPRLAAVATEWAALTAFVEPQLLSQASNAVVPNDYSLNQLAYQYAFQQNDFNGAAAISLLLLVIALALSAVFVTRGGLFETD